MATSLILTPELPLGLNGRRPGLPSALLLGALASLLIVVIMSYLAISAQLALTFARAERGALDQTPERYGLIYEPVRFPGRVDGVQFEGWLLEPARDSVVGRGFPVLTFDLRGSGHSQGAFFTLGPPRGPRRGWCDRLSSRARSRR